MMKLPIVRLVGRPKYKVIYKGEKWEFKKGVEYDRIHPKFSNHLASLRDDNGNPIFQIDNKAEIISIVYERSLESAALDEFLKNKMRRENLKALRREKPTKPYYKKPKKRA